MVAPACFQPLAAPAAALVPLLPPPRRRRLQLLLLVPFRSTFCTAPLHYRRHERRLWYNGQYQVSIGASA